MAALLTSGLACTPDGDDDVFFLAFGFGALAHGLDVVTPGPDLAFAAVPRVTTADPFSAPDEAGLLAASDWLAALD